jgi:hypothetical protein
MVAEAAREPLSGDADRHPGATRGCREGADLADERDDLRTQLGS